MPDLSYNGRYVLYAGRNGHLYRQDRTTGELVMVDVAPNGAPGNGALDGWSMSENGQWIAFTSQSTNIVPVAGASTVGVFLRDAGRHEGLTYSGSAESSTDPALVAQLMKTLEVLATDQLPARTGQPLAEAEIDRLRSEIRRGNETISKLKLLIESARPAEDLGLDHVFTDQA